MSKLNFYWKFSVSNDWWAYQLILSVSTQRTWLFRSTLIVRCQMSLIREISGPTVPQSKRYVIRVVVVVVGQYQPQKPCPTGRLDAWSGLYGFSIDVYNYLFVKYMRCNECIEKFSFVNWRFNGMLSYLWIWMQRRISSYGLGVFQTVLIIFFSFFLQNFSTTNTLDFEIRYLHWRKLW